MRTPRTGEIPLPLLLPALFCLLRQIPKTFDGNPLLSYRIAKNLMTAPHSGTDQVGHVEKLIFRHKVQDIRAHHVNATIDMERQPGTLLNGADPSPIHLYDPV